MKEGGAKRTEKIIVAGFGGQGVLRLGETIAYSAMKEGKRVTWIPSYGPESRGGTSNCHVIISDENIGSPVVDEPDVLIAMNLPSMDKFEPKVGKGGLVIYNSSLISREPKRSDLEAIKVPATDIANELGNTKVANMVALGAYIGLRKMVSKKTVVETALPDLLKGGKEKFIPINREAIDRGMGYVRNPGTDNTLR